MDQHTIVADIKRVAEDLGYPPSRTEYRACGKYPTTVIDRICGSWNAALKLCGYDIKGMGSPKRGHFEKLVEKHVALESLQSRFDAEIKPYAEQYKKPHKGKLTTLMVRGDDHAMWVDPWLNDVFFDVAKRLQPDSIVFNGDTVDFYEISDFSKDPQREFTLQQEIDFVGINMFARAREACPTAEIDWILGNHEWRLFRYLAMKSPGLSSLRCLQFDQLFNLKDYAINLVARPSFVTAARHKNLENWKTYAGQFTVTHGVALGKHPATSELSTFGRSGCSNHVHRHTIQEKRDLNGYALWHTNGCMCRLENGTEFIWELINWSQGFAIVHIYGDQIFIEYVNGTSGIACVGGKYYFRPVPKGNA